MPKPKPEPTCLVIHIIVASCTQTRSDTSRHVQTRHHLSPDLDACISLDDLWPGFPFAPAEPF